MTDRPPSSQPRAEQGPLLLRPMLAINDRMRTSARLATLLVLLLVPGLAASWAYSSAVSGQVALAEREISGLEVLAPALSALTVTTSGEEPDLAALSAAVRAHPGLGLAAELASVSAAGAGTTTQTRAIVDLVTRVGDTSDLVLDPDLDSFHVMDAQVVQLPRLLTATLESPATPSGADDTGASGSLTPAQRRAVQASRLTSTADTIDADIATAVRVTPALAPRLRGLTATSTQARRLATSLTAVPMRAADTAALTTAVAAAVRPATTAVRERLTTRARDLSTRRDLTLLLITVGFATAAWFGGATWWRTRRDVRLTVTAVSAIADGDLGLCPLPAGRDEIAAIARSLERARHLLVGQRADLVASHAAREDQMQAAYVSQRAAELQVRRRAQGIIDETATSVGAELRDLVAHVDSVRRAATEIEHRVATADSVTRAVVDHTRSADAGALSLGQSLRGVAGMAQLINSVADQTKLLALNAAIEAARAGAAGRGFTVVADEVKALAATTATSAQEITATIGALEADATQVGAAISSVGDGIAKLDEATAVLRGVATDQFAVVAGLDQALSATIDRVVAMSTLTERLEQRTAERFAANGSVVIDAAGVATTVPLSDLSSTGLRCSPPSTLRLSTGQEILVRIVVGAAQVRARAVVVRSEEHDHVVDVGLVFTDLDAAGQSALQRVLDSLV